MYISLSKNNDTFKRKQPLLTVVITVNDALLHEPNPNHTPTL